MKSLLKKGTRLPLWLTFGMPVVVGGEDKTTLNFAVFYYIVLAAITGLSLYYR